MAETPNQISKTETTFAYMAAGVVGFSLIDMFASLLLRLFNITPWAILAQIPLIGLPVGFLLIIGLLFASMRRRSKANRNR